MSDPIYDKAPSWMDDVGLLPKAEPTVPTPPAALTPTLAVPPPSAPKAEAAPPAPAPTPPPAPAATPPEAKAAEPVPKEESDKDWRTIVKGYIDAAADATKSPLMIRLRRDWTPVAANVLTESGGKFDAERNEGGRFTSRGLFQLADKYVRADYKDRAWLGSALAAQVPAAPPERSQGDANYADWNNALKRKPGGALYGIIHLLRFERWKNTYFKTDDKGLLTPKDGIAANRAAEAAKVADYLNKHPRLAPADKVWGLMRLYWAAGSLPGMAKLTSSGAADDRLARWLDFLKSERGV